MAADEESGALRRGGGFCFGKLFELPHTQRLGHCEFRSHINGVPFDVRARKRSLHLLPHQQQLQLAGCANSLWNFWMPFNNLAADE
jgi:hypothetical protein